MEQNNIIFSIIIPIYNAEKTLERCINSIRKCSLKNIEIICVDDQSTDNSEKIISQSMLNDPRIFKFCTQGLLEKGVCCARNLGIHSSNGEYILFIDSDDYFEDGIFEKLYDVILNYKPDLIDFGIYYNNNGCVYPSINQSINYEGYNIRKKVY